MSEQAQQPGGELRLRKLTWLCRRGMKELDVLLGRFLDRESAALQRGEWPEFESLLQLEDDQLWDCMLNPVNPAASEFHSLLENISHGTAQQD